MKRCQGIETVKILKTPENLLISEDIHRGERKFLRDLQSMLCEEYYMKMNDQYEKHLMDLTGKNEKGNGN